MRDLLLQNFKITYLLGALPPRMLAICSWPLIDQVRGSSGGPQSRDSLGVDATIVNMGWQWTLDLWPLRSLWLGRSNDTVGSFKLPSAKIHTDIFSKARTGVFGRETHKKHHLFLRYFKKDQELSSSSIPHSGTVPSVTSIAAAQPQGDKLNSFSKPSRPALEAAVPSSSGLHIISDLQLVGSTLSLLEGTYTKSPPAVARPQVLCLRKARPQDGSFLQNWSIARLNSLNSSQVAFPMKRIKTEIGRSARSRRIGSACKETI